LYITRPIIFIPLTFLKIGKRFKIWIAELRILYLRLKFNNKVKLKAIKSNTALIKLIKNYIKKKMFNNKLIAIINEIVNIDITFIF